MSKEQEPTKISESKQFSWGIIITTIFLIIFSLFLPANPKKSEPYSKFINQVESDRVERAIIGSTHIEYVLKSELVNSEAEQIFGRCINEG